MTYYDRITTKLAIFLLFYKNGYNWKLERREKEIVIFFKVDVSTEYLVA